MRQTRPRVLLADDHALFAAGLTKLLEPNFEVVGTASNGRALVEAAKDCHPDVVLLDISMPVLNGLEAARQLSATKPTPKLVFVTMHSDRPFVLESFRAGASAYVLKQSAASELSTALEEVLKDRIYVSPVLANLVPQGFLDSPGKPVTVLSARQRQVLQLVAEGHTAKDIAGLLKISAKTVEFHKGMIMKKLNLHTAAELTRHALKHGIAGDGSESYPDDSLAVKAGRQD